MKTKTEKLLNNSLIFGISNFGTKILSFLMTIIYTYVLTTEEYGVIDLIITSLALIAPIISLYLQDGVMRFVMDKRYDNKTVLSTALNVLNIIFFIVMVVFLFVIFIFNLRINYLILILVLFFQCYYYVIGQFVRGINRVKLFAIGGVINSVVLLLSSVLFLLIFRWSITGYLLAMLCSYIFSCIYYIKVGDVKYNYDFKIINNNYLSLLLKYCIPLIPNALMWWIVNASDRYMILLFLGKSMNGIYALACKIPVLVSLITSIFFQSFQQLAIEECDSDSKNIYFSKVFSYYYISNFIICSLLLFISKPLILMLVSSNYSISWKYVPFLLISVMFSSFALFLGVYYAMSKKTLGSLVSTGIAGIINIILNFILIPIIGLNGAAIATMISMLVLWFVRIINTKKIVNMQYNFIEMVSFLILILLQVLFYYRNDYCGYIGQIICIIILLFSSRNFLKNSLIYMFKYVKDVINNENKRKFKKI